MLQYLVAIPSLVLYAGKGMSLWWCWGSNPDLLHAQHVLSSACWVISLDSSVILSDTDAWVCSFLLGGSWDLVISCHKLNVPWPLRPTFLKAVRSNNYGNFWQAFTWGYCEDKSGKQAVMGMACWEFWVNSWWPHGMELWPGHCW